MNPDFSSLNSETDQDDDRVAFHPTTSASEMMKRRRDRSKRSFARACCSVFRYSCYVACIALLAGFSQMGMAVANDPPIGQSGFFILRTLCGEGIGAFVGFAIVSFFIVSPIVPMGPVTMVRVEPNIGDSEQWEDESRALLSAGIVFATIGSIFASATVSVDSQIYSSISTAGTIGSLVGVVVVICHVLIRRSKRRSITRAENSA